MVNKKSDTRRKKSRQEFPVDYNALMDEIYRTVEPVTSISYVRNHHTASQIMELRRHYLRHMKEYTSEERSGLDSMFNQADSIFNDLIRTGAF